MSRCPIRVCTMTAYYPAPLSRDTYLCVKPTQLLTCLNGVGLSTSEDTATVQQVMGPHPRFRCAIKTI